LLKPPEASNQETSKICIQKQRNPNPSTLTKLCEHSENDAGILPLSRDAFVAICKPYLDEECVQVSSKLPIVKAALKVILPCNGFLQITITIIINYHRYNQHYHYHSITTTTISPLSQHHHITTTTISPLSQHHHYHSITTITTSPLSQNHHYHNIDVPV
jgi:hypothetical protein